MRDGPAAIGEAHRMLPQALNDAAAGPGAAAGRCSLATPLPCWPGGQVVALSSGRQAGAWCSARCCSAASHAGAGADRVDRLLRQHPGCCGWTSSAPAPSVSERSGPRMRGLHEQLAAQEHQDLPLEQVVADRCSRRGVLITAPLFQRDAGLAATTRRRAIAGS
ncbi:hypothetical protein WGT02_39270 (plasmid) [Rhizobium sp. T1470]